MQLPHILLPSLIFLLSLRLAHITAAPTYKPLPLPTTPLPANPISLHTLSPRAPSTHLPGGWTLTLASTTTFTPLPPATTALNAFYRYALTELFTAGIETVSTR
ncbi:MAG: hypothetical protein Q9180_007473, partial [Flavoplaca navasiana]